jgi:long-chain acyl-CoA synthetase
VNAGPSHPEIQALLTGPGAPFETEVVEIRGLPTTVWKNAPRNLGDVLEEGRALGGARDLIRLDDTAISHDDHHRAVMALANRLADEFGVVKGDRVAIAMRNYPEWSIAFFATVVLGAIATPLNAFWSGPELAFGISDSRPRVLVVDGERLERLAPHLAELGPLAILGAHLDDRRGTEPLPAGVRDLAPLLEGPASRPDVDVAPDDPASIFYTSGTSGGRPKGVLGTHRNMTTTLVSGRYVGARQVLRDGIDPTAVPRSAPVLLLPVPLFHATGCQAILLSGVAHGATVVLMRRWDPEVALDLIEEHRITQVAGVPAMAWDLMSSPTLSRRSLGALVSIGGGGAASPPELLRRIKRELPGCGAGTGYGLTETSATVASISGQDYLRRPEAVGFPVPICDLRIVDELGRDVPRGERGELWIRGANVVPGYWDRPEETAATFTDGWLHSGDVAVLDAEGYLSIVDRVKDIIIRGGENVSSLEVEAALYEHPAVLEVAVFAKPDQVLGEEVAALVRPQPGATPTAEEIRAFLADRIAAFKIPSHIWFVDDALPRSGSGKLLKREIRSRFAPERV